MALQQVDGAKLVELLKALASSSAAERQKAEALYQQAKQQEPDSLMLGMMLVLGSAEVEEAVRVQCAVLLRQLTMRGHERDFVFARVTAQHQREIAAELLRRFELEASPRLRRKVGEAVAKLAEHCCDRGDPRGSLCPGGGGWPELLPLCFRMAGAPGEGREAALRLLRQLVPVFGEELPAAELGPCLAGALQGPGLGVQQGALLVVCELVGECERKTWQPLVPACAQLVDILGELARAGEAELLREALQALTEVASSEPDFFREQLQRRLEPARLLAGFCAGRDCEPGLRQLALEWLVSFLERRSKWVTRRLPELLPLALQACMDMLLEVDAGEEALEAWAMRMDDEEGEEGVDELARAGEEAIDRVVEAAQIGPLAPHLSRLVLHYAQQDSWQARHAALAAVKQTVEYVEDRAHVDAMASVLLQHLEHPHPRVRFMALHAIGQLANDQAPHFQESKHQLVMPLFLRMMDDGVDRVATMAMSAFVSFGEELDGALMRQHAQAFMEKLCAKLQVAQHRGIREESITSIAVIAGVLGQDFSRYYDSIMPVLRQFVLHARGERENRLRGKSFECMSLLGIAVGKERFLPDAREAIAGMLSTPLEADDVQREYIREASERICQCLGRDFAPFLPSLLGGVLEGLRLEEQEPAPARPPEEGEDLDFVEVSTGEGRLVRVRTERFREMMQSLQLLRTFMLEMGGAFYEWVPGTAEVLLPLLSAEDETSYLCDDCRAGALQAWGFLIRAAREGAEERQLPGPAPQLLRAGLQPTLRLLENGREPEPLAGAASGVTECLKSAGPGQLADAEARELVERVLRLVAQSLERTSRAERRRPARAPEDEDEDEDEQGREEEQLRRNYEEVLGAVMQVAAEGFLPCLPQCAERLREWLQAGKRVLALYLACDLVQHLGARSEPLWHVFMPEAIGALDPQADPDALAAACYCVNLAAPLPSFAEAAPEAFRRLARIVEGPRPRGKRAERGRLALDNAVAALLQLAKERPGQCPPEVQPWPAIIARLPLHDDKDEAKRTHATLVDLLIEEHQGLLGGPGRPNLGPLLGILAEVHHSEAVCRKEEDAKILRVFRGLPVDLLQSYAGGFTEKQQRKIELMLA